MDLIERQAKREILQLERGVERYTAKEAAQAAGDTTIGHNLTLESMNYIAPVITLNQQRLEGGESIPAHVPLAYQYLLELEADPVAYITARVVVSAAANRMKLTRTAMRLANMIEENYRFEELELAEPALANSMERKARRWASTAARRRIMRKAADVAGIARMGWSEQEKLKLGIKLVELFVDKVKLDEKNGETPHKPVAKMDEIRTGKLSHKIVSLTDDALRRMESEGETEAIDRPVNWPMICPPKRWTSPISGGYITDMLKSNLVRGIGDSVRDELFSSDMSGVYDAVNRVQATRWAINAPVLDVLQLARIEGTSIGGLPDADEQPKPERPTSIKTDVSPSDMPPAMLEKFKNWKNEMREVYEANAMLMSKRYALSTKVMLATELRDEEAIYFPHTMDFRGRIYSMTSELSPQSDDVAKSLIHFADGKPLGESGGYWLAVHIANLFGVDKVSFEDRVQWVLDNSDEIMESAMSPLDGRRFWCTADDPWCALAACFEWTGFQIEGPEYVSHLPIAMDGSCSGIQHFSAMLRDAEGGAAVNLRKCDKPTDIYMEVLAATKCLLAENPEPLAKVWMDAVDRKIVKRPCMTFAYSVTSIGIRDQIGMEMRKRSDGQFLPGHENWKAAAFLAPIVEQAIRQVVDRAAEAMDWLKKIAKQLTAEEMPTSWVTPLGFPVVQPYRKAHGVKVKVWFQGIRVRLTLRVTSTAIDGRKQGNSVAPNFVHSMDATHLMMVVNRLRDERITQSFAMIHDSFGVHACDVDEMHYIIRDEFINLYSNDVLTEMYQSTLLALPGEKWPDVPTPPEAGDLDLEEVRDAEFFFA